MASGRDAADVAITTSFGISRLNSFAVITEEVETVSQHSTMRAELCSVS
jgi:hypothetical protein